MTSRAIFLDRDGVLNVPVIRNGKAYAPTRAEDIEIYPGLREPIQRLKDRGFVILVVTNQPDVARGLTTMTMVDAINKAILQEIPSIDHIYACFHDNADNCDCRKPKPGMLLQGAKDYGLDLKGSFMIGDRWTDIAAGIAAGCRTIFIDRSYNEQEPTQFDYRVFSTNEALAIIENEKQ